MKYPFTIIVLLIFVLSSFGQSQIDMEKINKDYLETIRNMKNDMENLKDENESLLRKLKSLTSNQKSIAQVKAELVKEAKEILQAKAKNPEDMPTTEEVLKEAERLNEFVSKKPFGEK